jgi:hypothetical protein
MHTWEVTRTSWCGNSHAARGATTAVFPAGGKNRWTQQAVGALLGVDRSTVTKWFTNVNDHNGKSPPPDATRRVAWKLWGNFPQSFSVDGRSAPTPRERQRRGRVVLYAIRSLPTPTGGTCSAQAEQLNLADPLPTPTGGTLENVGRYAAHRLQGRRKSLATTAIGQAHQRHRWVRTLRSHHAARRGLT